MIDYRRLRVALLGAGAVGSQVAALLLKHGDELADRAGAALELVGIAVRDLDAPRDTDLPRELFTTDAETLIMGADIVIELMGGIVYLEPLRRFEERLRRATASSAQDMMTEEPVTIDASASVKEAARIIAEEGHNRLPVTDHGRFVGVVTRVDVLQSLAAE